MREALRFRGRYFALLFVACLATFLLLCSVFIANGRSLLWQNDGLSLYYTLFVFEGQWLRDIFGSIGRPDFSVPLYSLNLGYGADILATAGGCFNDPLNLLSAFCSPENAEYLFEVLIFLRFFLAAAAFSLYCFSRGKREALVLCGALAYVLCGYVVLWGVLRHPNFINLAILLPLVLWGADKVFERKNPALLMISMGLLFFFSVYFSYMTLIVLLVYCLLRYVFGERRHSLRDFAGLFGRFVLYLVVAALMAGLLLVPIVLVLTSMGRVGVTREIPLWETFNFWWSLGSNMIGGSFDKRGLFLGAVPALGVIAFLLGRRQLKGSWAPWAIGFGLCLAGAALPHVSSAMNGFGYATDRWLIILGFCAAYMLVLVIPHLRQFGKRQWAAFALISSIMVLWVAAWALDKGDRQGYLSCACLVVAAALLLIVGMRRLGVKGTSVALSVCLIATSCGPAIVYVSKKGSNHVSDFVPATEAYDYTFGLRDALKGVELDEAYRVDRASTYGARNQTMVSGLKGFDFFSSYYNQNVDNARYDVGMATHWTNYIYNGVDGRMALDLLGGARYFIASDDDADRVPYGYKAVADIGEMTVWDDDDEEGEAANSRQTTMRLYESDAALPLAFTYKTAVSESAYREKSLVERHEILTQSCVLADDKVDGEDAEALQVSTREQPVSVVKEKGLRIEDGVIRAAKKGARFKFEVEGVAGAENYVVFENLKFQPMDPADRRSLAHELGASVKEPAHGPLWWSDAKWRPGTSSVLELEADGHERVCKIASSDNPGYGGKVDWAVNMGYSEKPMTTFTVKFRRAGIYTFDKMYVASQPVAAIEENVKKLQEENAASVSFGTNRISVDVAAEKDGGDDERYVFLSVPYSPGWSATVDGQPAEILQANVGFMALAVDGAAHDIQLTYMTPGLVAGAWCSVAGIALFAGILVVHRKTAVRRKARKQR